MQTLRVAPPRLLAAALGLGLAGDGLLRAPLWGLNVTLLVAFLAAWGIQAQRLAGGVARGRSRWPWVGACGFAAMWMLRDEPTLLAFDLLAALGLLTLPLLAARGVPLRTAGALDLLTAPVFAVRQAVVGGVQAASRDLPWGSLAARERRVLRGALGGFVVAAPIAAVFGALFASADPTFRSMVQALTEWDMGPVPGHVALTTVTAWLTAGYLRGIVVGDSRRADPGPGFSAGALPVGIGLAAMVLVFTLFVAIQAGNLFRGDAYVREWVGLTFAEYARGGFFQLVIASALALPVVYAATGAAGAVEASALRSLRALQRVALGLVAAVALSALWRMRLYVSAYGLTQDRLYGAAIIVWIGVTIGVFARTVLVGKPVGAARGTLFAAVLVLALLNVVSPAALIARVNLDRNGGRGVDVTYLGSLGADAIPTIADLLPRLGPAERCRLARDLVEHWRRAPGGDWRGWNLARQRARASVSLLERAGATCPPPPLASL